MGKRVRKRGADWGRLQGRKLRTVAGLMSGTSCNGISVAVVRVARGGDGLRARFRSLTETPYPRRLRNLLLEAASLDASSLGALNVALGKLFGRRVKAHLERHNVGRIDLVGSHGHTVFHRPPRGGKGGKLRSASVPAPAFSYQIGEPAEIALRTHCPVVADFRPSDVAAGGEGAPLVPFGDSIMFRPRGGPRVCLNIGGMANVTVLDREGRPVLAFDTGPGTALLDSAARRLSRGRVWFDRDGRWAARGRVEETLLRRLFRHPFFRRPPPKSTGRETFGERFLESVLSESLSRDDLLATLLELTARSIAEAILALPLRPADVVAAGGGARNLTLLRRLRELLSPIRVRTSEELGWPLGAREPAAFALLAAAFVWGIPASFPGTTGIRRPSVLGKLVLPPR